MKRLYSWGFGILACVVFGAGCSSGVERDASSKLSTNVSPVSAGATDATFATSGKSQDLLADKNGLGQLFNISAKEAGDYHVRVWAMGADGDDPMSVYLDNGASPVGRIQTSNEGWKFYPLTSLAKGDTLKLSAGTHALSVYLKGDHVPQVDFFQISKSQFATTEMDSAHANYIAVLSSNVLPADYAAQKQANVSSQSASTTYSAPPYDYCSELNKTFGYTYWANLQLTAGVQVDLETRMTNPCASDPVLYLFKKDSPASVSWVNDDSNCTQSRIVVTPPVTGTYVVLARAYFPQYPGTTNLYKNGQLFASNIALGGALGTCG